jgi:zinc transporter, ZIP family
VAEAFAWGLIAGSSLLLGGLLALSRPVSQHTLGLVIAFGAGVLISTVAYELVEDAFGIAGGSGAVALGLFAGVFAFYFGDLAIDRFGGKEECGRGSERGLVPRHRARSIVARRRAGFRCARDA